MHHLVREILGPAIVDLERAGVDSARFDAEVLLAHVLDVDRPALARVRDVTVEQADAFRELVQRRAGREPLQHLTGSSAFRYLDVVVGPGVFVPRPETEVLTQAAIDELSRLVDSGVQRPVAVDLCTGSGAVAAAMASEVPQATVTAVELSPQAHAFAVRNAQPYGVDVRLGDIADAVDDLAGQVHVVTANPPYIPLSAFESVAPEARDFDPPLALWSGEDGLDVIRVVARVGAHLLVDNGLVVCEHADSQGTAAPAVFASSGLWTQVRDNLDLSRRPRFVSARRVPADRRLLAP
ncbi:MAG TPA: peptide chain release factor N(5)-glutamine methyltransferase [Nocardioidaceae bacterium]|nr:peptide chain release factor N(5)-glutamine methyltransferase [Nocardioidaceae bacterium]